MAEIQGEKGGGSGPRFEIKRQGYTLVFELSSDALECYCSYVPSTIGGTPLTLLELQGYLKQYAITAPPIPEAESTLLVSAVSATPVSRLLLAQGIPMIPGEDAQILMGVSDDLAQSESPGGDADTVDFRNVQAFLNVEEGALVATIMPPGSGTPGQTVTGKVIPPLPGVPVVVECGQNVRLSEDGRSVIALGAGRVCLRENVLSVEDIYVIKGDVDFKVGNISFKGFVEVTGDVLDGFFIKATKGIKVLGNIGVCVIESEGDISFCGMNGQGSGSIKCGGSITANFICDTLIECAGNVSADVEIRSSTIKCLGVISVNKGGLTGGEYFALAGIECTSLGSITSLRTRVVAGVHFGDLEELNILFNELKTLVAEFSAAPKGSIDMKEFAQKRASITARTQEVRSRTYEQCNPKINVKKRLFEGVNITLGLVSDIVREERNGSTSIIENTVEGGFRFLGLTPLTFTAKMIEQTFRQQYELDQQKNRFNTAEGGP